MRERERERERESLVCCKGMVEVLGVGDFLVVDCGLAFLHSFQCPVDVERTAHVLAKLLSGKPGCCLQLITGYREEDMCFHHVARSAKLCLLVLPKHLLKEAFLRSQSTLKAKTICGGLNNNA